MSIPSARVVAITKPLVPEAQTAGEFVAYAARVSNPANQANTETAPRLIDYLKRNKHWSPFEMAHAVVEVVTTRDIARQLLRHRSFSFQEWSGRYAEMPDDIVLRPSRLQDMTNRQSSLPETRADRAAWWDDYQRRTHDKAHAAYRWALDNGIAKEVARAVLPEGLTVSTLYVAGSYRSWLHYLEVREHPSTQLEHRQLARAIRAALAEHEPMFAEVQA